MLTARSLIMNLLSSDLASRIRDDAASLLGSSARFCMYFREKQRLYFKPETPTLQISVGMTSEDIRDRLMIASDDKSTRG